MYRPEGLEKNVLDGLRAFGVPEEIVAKAEAEAIALREATEPPPQQIHSDNWEDWIFFLSVSNQWNYDGGMSPRRRGLRFEGVEASAKMQGILSPRRHRALFESLRVIEDAVLDADRKAIQRASKD